MPFKHAQTFLNNIGSDVRDGKRFDAGTVNNDLAPATVLFLSVVQDEELTAVRQVYGTCSAVQMVWPDSSGRFPWDAGYNNPPDVQPLLGPRPTA